MQQSSSHGNHPATLSIDRQRRHCQQSLSLPTLEVKKYCPELLSAGSFLRILEGPFQMTSRSIDRSARKFGFRRESRSNSTLWVPHTDPLDPSTPPRLVSESRQPLVNLLTQATAQLGRAH